MGVIHYTLLSPTLPKHCAILQGHPRSHSSFTSCGHLSLVQDALDHGASCWSPELLCAVVHGKVEKAFPKVTHIPPAGSALHVMLTAGIQVRIPLSHRSSFVFFLVWIFAVVKKGSHYVVVQVCNSMTSRLASSLECWRYKCVPPCLGFFSLLFFSSLLVVFNF